MASVEKRMRDGRTTYVVRWRDAANVQRKKSFARKVDADRYRTEIEHRLNSGSYVDPAAGKVTFRAYAEQWRAIQVHRPNTADRVASQLTKHAYPKLGARAIASIRPSDVQALATGLSADLAPGSVRTVMSTVRAVFRAATHDRVIGLDPCERITLPEVPRRQITPLLPAQVRAIAAKLPARYRALALVGAGTGLRQGELFGLQVRDVDFLRRVLRVERQVQPVHGVPVASPPKNRSAYRTVPLGKVVVDELAAHLRDFPAAGEGYVFTDEDGKPLVRQGFAAKVWRPAVKAAGLAGTGMHDLRHAFASTLIAAGQSVKVVSERLGHANAAMTLNVYSHLWPADEDRTRQAVDDAFGSDAPRVRPAKEA